MLNNKVITSILAFKKDVCDPEINDLEKNIGALRSILDEFGIACPDDVAKGLCTMPASRNYHGNYEGGLFAHSLNVALALASLTDNLALEWQKDRSPILVGLFHDLCKIDLYEMTEDGYVFAEGVDHGHGDKSVRIAKSFVPDLTEEEELCIRWHMGAFDEKENWKQYNAAIAKYPNVLFAHTADMIASQIVEV